MQFNIWTFATASVPNGTVCGNLRVFTPLSPFSAVSSCLQTQDAQLLYCTRYRHLSLLAWNHMESLCFSSWIFLGSGVLLASKWLRKLEWRKKINTEEVIKDDGKPKGTGDRQRGKGQKLHTSSSREVSKHMKYTNLVCNKCTLALYML